MTPRLVPPAARPTQRNDDLDRPALEGAEQNRAAVRAAASACSHNPVPLVMPCHRVVRSDGTIGQYLGGTVAKAALLALEAAA